MHITQAFLEKYSQKKWGITTAFIKFFSLPKWAFPILLYSHVLRKLCSSFIILHLPTCCPWQKKYLAEIETLSDNYCSIFSSFFSTFKTYFIKENNKEVPRWQLRSHLILKSRGPVPTDILGTSDVVIGKKTNIGRSNGSAEWKWKVRNMWHQGVDETLSCPSYGKLPPIDSSGEERPLKTAEKRIELESREGLAERCAEWMFWEGKGKASIAIFLHYALTDHLGWAWESFICPLKIYKWICWQHQQHHLESVICPKKEE